MVVREWSKKRLLLEMKTLRGRQLGVVRRHETHARAARDEIPVNDGQ